MKNIYTVIFFISFFLFTAGCKVAEKQFREGDYDQAIDMSVKKLQRDADKENYALILEEAFKRANQKDLDAIKQLNMEGQPERWEEIYAIYQSISRRQNKIKPLIPLYIQSEKRDAQFDFVDIIPALTDTKKRAAEFWYADATQKLNTGNKYKARDAYNELSKIKTMYGKYKDVDELMERAKKAGINNVGFDVQNNSNAIVSTVVYNALLNMQPSNISGDWFRVYANENEVTSKDYTMVISINRVESFPEKVNTNNYQETKQIEDGFTYIYDANGNVMKDSTGNDMKTIKYKTVSAYVSETWQEKIATIEGEIKYMDVQGKLLKSIPVKGDGIFKNYYASATGYYDALTQQSKSKLGGKPLPFPNDEELIIEAIRTLQGVLNNAMNIWNDDLLNG